MTRLDGSDLKGTAMRIEYSHGSKAKDKFTKRDSRDRSRERSKEYNGRTKECYVCEKVGHWAKECPRGLGLSSAEDNKGAQEGKCFSCGSSSHKVWNCPKQSQNRRRSRSRSDSRRRSHKSRHHSRSRSHSEAKS